MWERPVWIDAAGVELEGELVVPDEAVGAVVFAHGSGSSRRSPRNQAVAQALQRRGLATLLFDLLSADEAEIDARTAELRFDIELLSTRLVGALDWVGRHDQIGERNLPIGCFGASTGAAAALTAAVARPEQVAAVVSRGGRPDLAADALELVRAPTRLIVGGSDAPPVISINRRSLVRLNVVKDLVIVPGASHLFDEPGALEQVAQLAAEWFLRHFAGHLARQRRGDLTPVNP